MYCWKKGGYSVFQENSVKIIDFAEIFPLKIALEFLTSIISIRYEQLRLPVRLVIKQLIDRMI